MNIYILHSSPHCLGCARNDVGIYTEWFYHMKSALIIKKNSCCRLTRQSEISTIFIVCVSLLIQQDNWNCKSSRPCGKARFLQYACYDIAHLWTLSKQTAFSLPYPIFTSWIAYFLINLPGICFRSFLLYCLIVNNRLFPPSVCQQAKTEHALCGT